MKKASLFLLPLLFICLVGCAPLIPRHGRTVMIETTGYCDCKKCCGWKRNWFGQPVYAYGPNKGKPKKVGITSDGTRAKKGTLAADTRYYKYGTKMYIPGYGNAVVHDRGGAIKGPQRLDLFFPSHKQALKWGRRKVMVTIYD